MIEPKQPFVIPYLLKEVHIKGYRSIKRVDVDLGPGLNIFIGDNASGKSNFFKAIHIGISAITQGIIPDQEMASEFVLETNNENIGLSFDMKQIASLEENEINIVINQKLKIGTKQFERKEKLSSSSNSFVPIYRSDEVRNVQALFPLPLIKIDYGIPEDVPILSSTINIEMRKSSFRITGRKNSIIRLGQSQLNLAIGIYNSFYEGKKNSRKLNSATKKFEEAVVKCSNVSKIRVSDKIKVLKSSDGINIEDIVLEFKINGGWYSWSQLSDGTKRAIHIASQLTASRNTLLIEEPELGLYPHQLFKLMTFIKERSISNQIIISTHSPMVLDFLDIDKLNQLNIVRVGIKYDTKIDKLSEQKIAEIIKYLDQVGPISEYWVNTNNLL